VEKERVLTGVLLSKLPHMACGEWGIKSSTPDLALLVLTRYRYGL
jgi:hypothetical protein